MMHRHENRYGGKKKSTHCTHTKRKKENNNSTNKLRQFFFVCFFFPGTYEAKLESDVTAVFVAAVKRRASWCFTAGRHCAVYEEKPQRERS